MIDCEGREREELLKEDLMLKEEWWRCDVVITATAEIGKLLYTFFLVASKE